MSDVPACSMHTKQTTEITTSLSEGVSRLVSEHTYAQGVQENFSQHVEKHRTLDALARCRALNSFLAENVRFFRSALIAATAVLFVVPTLLGICKLALAALDASFNPPRSSKEPGHTLARLRFQVTPSQARVRAVQGSFAGVVGRRWHSVFHVTVRCAAGNQAGELPSVRSESAPPFDLATYRRAFTSRRQCNECFALTWCATFGTFCIFPAPS